jgi:hypothetical protein
MTATATRTGNWLGFLPVREFFALDVRSLALFRIGLAVMVLVDWIDRLPDLRAHYSDAGIVPRDVVTGVLPISVHFFHGSVWFQAVLLGLALVFGLMLLVGYRTPLACLASWFLLISVHARNPALLQGGDQLLRMLLFWSIFLPLGACYSIDAARATGPPRDRRVLSPATFAFIVQLCLVYFFASAWKWAPEWRGEGNAVYLALRVESFTTRIAYLMLEYPDLLRYFTWGTVCLETLGPVLLFLPFNVGFQRVLAIGLFILFHLGLALTMELGNFPFVCMVAWAGLLPPSFWNRLRAQMSPAGKGLTVLYDPERGRARWATTWLRSTLFVWDAGWAPAADTGGLLARLRKQGGWGVLGSSGRELFGSDALAGLVAASPVFWPLARLAHSFPGRWLARLVGGRPGAGAAPAVDSRPPAWTPPGGAVVQAVILFCLVFVVLLNLRHFVSTRNQAFPNPVGPTADNTAILPNHTYPFAFALGLDQGWGLFAPRPGVFVGWYLAVGIQKDGTHIDLFDGGKPIDDSSPSTRPTFQAGTYVNGRWRKLNQNLSQFDFGTGARNYPYLLPGLANYLNKEWNSQHEGDQQLRAVEIIWWKEETRPPGVEPPPPQRIRLLRYEPDAPRERRWTYWTPGR